MPKLQISYDPLKLLTDAAESKNIDVQALAKRREEYWEWLGSWGIGKATSESLLKLGPLFQVKEGTFWLEFRCCDLACRKRGGGEKIRDQLKSAGLTA